MLCYKDKTFCPYCEDCKEGLGCHRALTHEVKKQAEYTGLPISQFAEKPDCYKEQK